MLQLSLDGAPVKLFTSRYSTNVEIYGRTIVCYNEKGEAKSAPPELAMPPSPNASGIASTVPIESLYLEELTSSGGFKILLINFDVGMVPTHSERIH